MIVATIKMTVPPEKLKEVVQTFKSILAPIRCEKGCISCNFYVDVESENYLLLKEEWKSSGALDTHLKSVHYGVLIGAMKLLKKEPEIKFCTVASITGAEVIYAARAR